MLHCYLIIVTNINTNGLTWIIYLVKKFKKLMLKLFWCSSIIDILWQLIVHREKSIFENFQIGFCFSENKTFKLNIHILVKPLQGFNSVVTLYKPTPVKRPQKKKKKKKKIPSLVLFQIQYFNYLSEDVLQVF